MAVNDINARDMIQSKLKEGTLAYSQYDGQGRLVKVIEAPIYVKAGDPCLVTDLKYVGATTAVLATKEYVGAWDDSYHFDNL